jgi:hypothetical protein
MEMLRVLRQIGAGRIFREALHQTRFETDRCADRGEVVRRAILEVDPEQLAFADVLAEARRQIDLTVLSVGVIEADARPAVALVGDGDQWTTASRIATSAAMNAVPYWSTSIDRSTCSLVGLSITPPWGITV